MIRWKRLVTRVLATILLVSTNVNAKFYSVDSMSAEQHIKQGNIHGFNRYAYANNNPYRFTDPDGKEGVDIRLNARVKLLASGQITPQEYSAQNMAEGVGGLVGLAVVATRGAAIPALAKLAKSPGGIPKNWSVKPTKNNDGKIYVNPKNQHDRVRVMQGNPKSSNPAQQKPYVKQQKNGRFIDKNGIQVSGKSKESHIPLKDYKYKE